MQTCLTYGKENIFVFTDGKISGKLVNMSDELYFRAKNNYEEFLRIQKELEIIYKESMK